MTGKIGAKAVRPNPALKSKFTRVLLELFGRMIFGPGCDIIWVGYCRTVIE